VAAGTLKPGELQQGEERAEVWLLSSITVTPFMQ